MIKPLFLDRHFFIGSLYILLNCSLIMPFVIEFVDVHAACGRRSRAKLLIEAVPGRGCPGRSLG